MQLHATSYTSMQDLKTYNCVSVLPVLHTAKQAQAASEAEAGPSGANTPADLPGQASGLPVHLSAMRKADVSDFKGTVYVNIREYYEVDLAICCLSISEPMIAHLEAHMATDVVA